MIIAEHTIVIEATPEAVWKAWQDVASWPHWDVGIQSATINGPFAPGTKGRIKIKGGGRSEFTITDVVELKAFTEKTQLPFAELEVFHEMTILDGQVQVTRRYEVTGFLASIFNYFMGKRIASTLPFTMKSFKTFVEKER
jgi:uncharacterized membrane protein